MKEREWQIHMASMTLPRKNILVCSGFIAADLLCPIDKHLGSVLLSTLAVQLERQKSGSVVRLAEPEYAHLRGERQHSVYKCTRTLSNSVLESFLAPSVTRQKPHVLSTGVFLIPSNLISKVFLLP